MTQVRSVSIGVWLTRGSRHETAERERHRPLRRAHALQGHRHAHAPRTSPRRSIRSAASSTRSPPRNTPSYYIKVLDEHLPLAVDILSDIVRNPAFSADDIEREKKVVLEEIKMVEDTPDDLVHELFTQGFWEDHPLGRPILGTHGDGRVVHADVAARLLPQRLHGAEPDRRRPSATSSTIAVRELVERDVRRARRAPASRSPSSAPQRRAEDPRAQQGARAEPRVPRRQQLSAEPRRPLRELRAEHAARRLDELAAVSERAREARAGLRGVQRPERLPRRRLVHDLRRLRQRSGRRGDRPRRRGAARREARRRCPTPSCSARRIT